MNKHYGLNDPIWQVTNYVVYPPFFENIKLCDSSASGNERYAKSAKTEAASENQVCQIISSLMYRKILNNQLTDKFSIFYD